MERRGRRPHKVWYYRGEQGVAKVKVPPANSQRRAAMASQARQRIQWRYGIVYDARPRGQLQRKTVSETVARAKRRKTQNSYWLKSQIINARYQAVGRQDDNAAQRRLASSLREDAPSVAAVAERLNSRYQVVRGVLRRYEQNGFVLRDPGDPIEPRGSKLDR